MHFLNCAALAYVPHVLAYRFSALAEDTSAFKKCATAGFIHLITETIKIFLVASIFPNGLDEVVGYDLLQSIAKAIFDVGDLVGLYIAMTQFVKGEHRVLAVAVGWSMSQALLSFFFPLLFGARGAEFHWKYLQMAIQANIYLVCFSTKNKKKFEKM